MVELNKMSYDEALTQTGWLHKKSSSVFGGYQKRFFSISPENKLLFAETNGGKNKGLLDLDFSKVSCENETSFKIVIMDKEFLFKTETSDEKNKWINALTTILSHKKKILPSPIKIIDSDIILKRTFEVYIIFY